MIRFVPLLCLVFLSHSGLAQSTQKEFPHLKVLLIGTFHFGQTGDKGKISFEDLFSAKRQAELQDFTNQLAGLKPDRVFVEHEPNQQAYWDGVFTQYRAGTLDTNAIRNEIFQVGIRTARKAGLSEVICVDHQQPLPYDEMNNFNPRTEKDSVAQKEMATYKLFALEYPYPQKTKKLADLPLSEYYLCVNSPEYVAADRADYFLYSPAYG